ncbi:MAG TPA: (2Fe-2S) ferredoxin domain-containing protein [Synechococcales cyanobacterium M55_K2018_004]|nr:(2Fe-2S) ferredoxin domain-containing protein [Synechococcales cyanobacterium M55_K2018_004]
MRKPNHHIFVCASFRLTGEAKGACQKKHSTDLMQYLTSELSDRGMDDVTVSTTGCLSLCDNGPVMLVYPDNYWYGNVNEEGIDRILDALEENQASEEDLLTFAG